MERNFLVVAADGQVRETLTGDLRDSGINVTLAESGAEAVRVAQAISVDAVLVESHIADMGMDDFNMFDFMGPAAIGGFFAVLYLWLIAPRITPERQPPMSGAVSRLYTAQIRLKAGDRITTADTQANLREYARLLGGTLFSGDQAVDAEHPLSAEGEQIAEVVITPGSRLNGIRIGNARLRGRYGLRLLAFNRFEGTQERK